MVFYENINLLGTGGFGQVWTCSVKGRTTLYAKKVLVDQDSGAVRRFAREARILASLDHPNIIRIVSKHLRDTPPYYIMPLYATSLRSEVPRLVGDEPRVFLVFSAILDAIEYAHAQGVIHRDLKPENVLLNNDTDVVVSDFGLGRILDAESTRLTRSGAGMGTPFYVAPEQMADAKAADQRADVFSLGRILYEMYSGSILSSVQDLSKLPPGIAVIISRCTAADPSSRFHTVSELKQAWHAIFDPAILQTELDQLGTLRAELSLSESVTPEKARRLLEMLARHQDDADLVHETIMQIDASAVLEMLRADQELTRRLMNRFVELVVHQAWGFDYTDRIANQCRAIYSVIPDFETRASLIRCVLLLGVDHNRWHVLHVFAELVLRPKQPAEHIPLVDQLGGLNEIKRREGARWLMGQEMKLHPALRPLFQFDDILPP
jgi:hypothetical protein